MLRYLRSICAHCLEAVLCLLLLTLVGVTFAQVVARYILHVSLAGSEEAARFLLMWLTTLAAAYGFKTKAHFSLMFVVSLFDERSRGVISVIVSSLVSCFLILLIVQSFPLIKSGFTQIAPATQIPMAFAYLSIPIGGIAMLYYVVKGALIEIRGIRTGIDGINRET